MRKLMLSMLFILFMSTMSFGNTVANGNTHSDLGMYKIELSENTNSEELTTYVISYENSPLEVMVIVDKDKKCENYVVSTDDISVKYVCDGKYFGISKTNNHQIANRAEYFHQKVLTQGTGTGLENVQLIAVYFPMLIKNS